MDFRLSDEHRAVRDLARRIVADLATPDRLRGLDEWFDRTAWSKLADAGLLGVPLPAETGGAGLGFLAAHLVLCEIGRAAAPLPFWEAIVNGAMPVAAFGSPAQRDALLVPVVSGESLLTAALSEGTAWDGSPPQTTASPAGDGWELEGTKTSVPLAPLAATILVPATTADGGVGVWLVAAAAQGVELHRQDVITGAPYAEVVLNRVAVDRDALLGDTDGAVYEWLLRHATAGLASLTAGACEAAVRLSADYTSRREQFERPIATFQAVAQRVADAYIDAEGAVLTALQAAWRLTEGLDSDDEIAIAKWWAAEAGHRVLHAAHHVHGGVGVDREYPLHRYFALVKQNEFALGGGPAQLLKLGAAMAAEPA